MVSLTMKEVFCLLYSVFLFLSGLFLVGLSVVFTYRIFYNFKFFPSVAVGPFIFLFLFGIVHLLLTWLAIKGPVNSLFKQVGFGAVRNSRNGLVTLPDRTTIQFLVITIVLFMAEFGIGVWNVVLWNNVDLESVLLLTESYETVIGKDFKENSAWNRLQTELKCCGLNGVKDFGQAGSYPTFCCDGRKGFNITCFDNGCRQPLADYASGIMLDGVLMSFLSCLLQAFGVFIFFSFFQTLKRDRDIKSARRLAILKELAEHSEHATPLTQSPLPSTAPMYTPQRNETPKSSKRRSSKAAAPLTPPVQVNV